MTPSLPFRARGPLPEHTKNPGAACTPGLAEGVVAAPTTSCPWPGGTATVVVRLRRLRSVYVRTIVAIHVLSLAGSVLGCGRSGERVSIVRPSRPHANPQQTS